MRRIFAFLHDCSVLRRKEGEEVWHMNNWSFICGALPWIAHHADQALTTYGDKTTFLDLYHIDRKMFPSPKCFCPSHCHGRRWCKTMERNTTWLIPKEKLYYIPFLLRFVWIETRNEKFPTSHSCFVQYKENLVLIQLTKLGRTGILFPFFVKPMFYAFLFLPSFLFEGRAQKLSTD